MLNLVNKFLFYAKVQLLYDMRICEESSNDRKLWVGSTHKNNSPCRHLNIIHKLKNVYIGSPADSSNKPNGSN